VKRLSKQTALWLALAGTTALLPAAALAVGAAADQSARRGNRLLITFEETRVAIQEPPGFGMRQVIVSGVGTFDGFGAATELAAVSQDLTVAPCGAGSNTSTILRRIVVPEQGTLILKSLAHRCPAPFGIHAVGAYEVDGASSTGIFAGAKGRGSDEADIEPPPSGRVLVTISGKLHLVKTGEDG
jgi:hypothetical protein